MLEICREFRFEAAHRLPNVADGHKCGRLHGHSYRVVITVRGDVVPTVGWVQDFADLDAAFAPLHQALDHRYLNEISGLENPTSENTAMWIWERLVRSLPLLHRVEVNETCTSGCIYSGPHDQR